MSLITKINQRVFYGWVIVGVSVVIGGILLGLQVSFGVFFKSFETEFELSRLATSSIFSLYMVFSAVFSFLGGWARDKFGPRIVLAIMGLFCALSLFLTSQANAQWQLFVTYSLLLAIGTAAALPVLMTGVSRWFSKKRGLALGISSSGVNAGRTIAAPFAAFLITSIGWRMSYMVLGIVSLVAIIPTSLLLKNDPSEIGSHLDGIASENRSNEKNDTTEHSQPPDITLVKIFRSGNYWVIFFNTLCMAFCFFLINTHVIPHSIDMGISTVSGASILSIIGVFSILSRLVTGSVSDIIGRKAVFVASMLLQAVALLSLLWLNDLWMLYIFAAFFGISFGGMDVLVLAIIADAFMGKNLGAIMGTLAVSFAIGAASGPVVSGYIFDTTSSYGISFAIGAGIMLSSAIAVALFLKKSD